MPVLRRSARIGCTLDDERRAPARVAAVPAPAVDALEIPGESGEEAAAVEPEAAGRVGRRLHAPGSDVGDDEAGALAAITPRDDVAGGVDDHGPALEMAAVRDGHPGERAFDRA